MNSIPFLAMFGEKTKPVQVVGRYCRHSQTSIASNRGHSSGETMATTPTHVETGTGGHNDTDTDAVED